MQNNMNIPFYQKPSSFMKWAEGEMDWSSDTPTPLEQSRLGGSAKKPTKWVRAKDYCQKALELLNHRQWRSAQTLLQKGLLEVEKTATAYHLLGLAFYHQGLFQKALDSLNKACDQDPQAEYFLHLSIVLNETGRYKEAKLAYEKALRLQSQSSEQNWKKAITERHNQTATTYLKRNQLKPALQEYIKGLRFQPHQPVAKLQIARLLWQLNYKTIAKKYLKAFISLHPQNKPAYLLLAGWHFEEAEIPQAVSAWEHVLNLDPKDRLARTCLMKVQQMSEWS